MAKKLVLLAMATAVVALAVPALASASKFTMPANVLVPDGTNMETTASNTKVETSLGTIECESFSIEFEPTINNGSSVEGVGIGQGIPSGCFVEGTPITVTDVTMANFKSTTSGVATTSLSFSVDLPGGIVCTYRGTNMPATYTSGSSSFQISEAELTAEPEICGEAFLNGNQVLETAGLFMSGLVIVD